MSKQFTIPNLLVGSNDSAINSWRKYFTSQKNAPIKVIDRADDIKKIIANTRTPETAFSVGLIVMFPRSVKHAHDFLEGLESSSAIAMFLKNGNAVVEINEQVSHGSYQDAWQIIVTRTGGMDAGVPPQENLPAVEKLITAHEALNETLQKWIDAFKKIPCVISAAIYDGEIPDRYIEITISRSPQHQENPIGVDDWSLEVMNQIYHNDYHDKSTEVYDNWCDETREIKNLTWQQFYDRVLILNERYIRIPELQE